MKRLFALIHIFAVPALMSVACGPAPVPTSTANSPTECTSMGQTWVSPRDGVTLVCVPAGPFQMGASEADPLAKDSEKLQHEVNLDAYWVDKWDFVAPWIRGNPGNSSARDEAFCLHQIQ